MEIEMNTSNFAGRKAPSANDQFVPVLAELLDSVENDALRLKGVQAGDILVFDQDGQITGFWRVI
jgi:hypothetical protein